MPIKVVFVCLLDPGHLQIPIAIGKQLMFRDPKNEIYFTTDEANESKIKGIGDSILNFPLGCDSQLLN